MKLNNKNKAIMKLRELNEAFPIVKEVFDSIKEWQRVVDLSRPFKELKEQMEVIEDGRLRIVNTYAEKESGKIPDSLQKIADKEFIELLDSDIELKNPIKFKKEEVEKSGIKPSDYVKIMDSFVLGRQEEE